MKHKLSTLVKKISFKFSYWGNRFFLSSADRRFIAVNKSYSFDDFKSKELRILLQMPEDYFYPILFSSLLRSLRKKFNLKINWLNVTIVFHKKGVLNAIRKLPIFYRTWEKIYLSNGGEVVYRNTVPLKDISQKDKEDAGSVFSQLKTKQNILDISRDGILLGDLIYDTYLRFKPAATIDLKDPLLKEIILSAFDHVVRQKKFLSENPYDYLFTSYSSYIHHGILVRNAYHYNIKIISFGNYDQLGRRIRPIHPSHCKEFYTYSEIFKTLSDTEKKAGIANATKHLESRFSGNVDLSTYYMSKSAYYDDGKSQSIFENNGKKRIVIFLHDFFDSPHLHRYMFYEDFYEWVMATVPILQKTDCDIYIKPHPNGVVGNEEVVEDIRRIFPTLKYIPKTVSNNLLIREGFDLGLTIYGTLAHEFPYFGIPILNAGDNPHINYDFCVHPRSKEHYEYLLEHLNEIPTPTPADREKIREFYYMHSLHLLPGKLEITENAFINQEGRSIASQEDFAQFVKKYEQKQYRDKLDQILIKSIDPLLESD